MAPVRTRRLASTRIPISAIAIPTKMIVGKRTKVKMPRYGLGLFTLKPSSMKKVTRSTPRTVMIPPR